jgi:hypothetical protein
MGNTYGKGNHVVGRYGNANGLDVLYDSWWGLFVDGNDLGFDLVNFPPYVPLRTVSIDNDLLFFVKVFGCGGDFLVADVNGWVLNDLFVNYGNVHLRNGNFVVDRPQFLVLPY